MITNKAREYALMKAYDYLDKDVENRVKGFIDTVVKFSNKSQYESQIQQIENEINNKGVWYDFALSLFTDIDDEVRRVLFRNFVIHSYLDWAPKRDELREKYQCNIPWTVLMDPTSACNLNCIGCWAADYGNKLNMDFDTLDSIVEQGKELGMYTYLFSGGEPLVRKKDIIALCNKHNDCVFLSFTNGTLIDEEFVEDMLRVKNFIPAISVEGFGDATDDRRGKGVFHKVEKAMELLKKNKLPFGLSTCYTSANIEAISSEEYIDWMIDKGAKFCWYFTFMPVGVNSTPELMATAEQRKIMYEKIREYRKTKPIFTIDFWNDGEYVKGCIAGGRHYLHINANGDIEPCAFIHYSDSNIYEQSLLEALQRPLFMEYHDNQPFNKNHLRPCPVLDNPGRLTHMVHQSQAHSTDLEAPEDVKDLSDKCVETSIEWAKTADQLWKEHHQ